MQGRFPGQNKPDSTHRQIVSRSTSARSQALGDDGEIIEENLFYDIVGMMRQRGKARNEALGTGSPRATLRPG